MPGHNNNNNIPSHIIHHECSICYDQKPIRYWCKFCFPARICTTCYIGLVNSNQAQKCFMCRRTNWKTSKRPVNHPPLTPRNSSDSLIVIPQTITVNLSTEPPIRDIDSYDVEANAAIASSHYPHIDSPTAYPHYIRNNINTRQSLNRVLSRTITTQPRQSNINIIIPEVQITDNQGNHLCYASFICYNLKYMISFILALGIHTLLMLLLGINTYCIVHNTRHIDIGAAFLYGFITECIFILVLRIFKRIENNTDIPPLTICCPTYNPPPPLRHPRIYNNNLYNIPTSP